MKKALMCMWFVLGVYFVISAAGRGTGCTTAMAMACGFWVARNMADVVNQDDESCQ